MAKELVESSLLQVAKSPCPVKGKALSRIFIFCKVFKKGSFYPYFWLIKLITLSASRGLT